MTYEKLYREFLAFHAVNPQVYEQVKERAYELIRKGWDHYEINIIWAVIRYRFDTTLTSNLATFKMPNNHRAFYARLFLADHPQYPKFFRTAYQRSKGPVPTNRYGVPLDDCLR